MFAVCHGLRKGVWTCMKTTRGGLLLVASPVWLFGSLMVLARGTVRGVFGSNRPGFWAAFRSFGPMLRTRGELKAERRISPGELASAFARNPFTYLGRTIQSVPFAKDESEIRSTSANARKT